MPREARGSGTPRPRRYSARARLNTPCCRAATACGRPAGCCVGDVSPASTANHEFGFGDVCAAGSAPTGDIDVDWHENAAGTFVGPTVTSTLCLQSTNAEARIALEYRDNNHVVIGQYGSNPAQGNNGALNQFSVNKTGPRISSAAVNHVHVQIQEKVNGSWQDVPGAFKFADYP